MTEAQTPARRTPLAVLLALAGLAVLVGLAFAGYRNPLWLYPRSEVQVFLLAGQSNMAGRGFISPQDAQSPRSVYRIDAGGRIHPASHPLHRDKSSAGFGMGIPFAEAIRGGCGECAVLLVPAAVGGSTLQDWQPGGEAYESALTMTRQAMAQGELQAVLWHQGESEARFLTEGQVPDYVAALTRTVAAVREAFGEPDLPWIAGTLGNGLAQSGHHPRVAAVNRAIAQAAETIPHFYLVETSDLDDLGDRVHFSTPALREMGRRYADAWARVGPALPKGPVPRQAGTGGNRP